jgi:hypothetical protein
VSATAVVERWARETEDRLRRVLRASSQDVAESVSVGSAYSPGTPVDTGFARSMWTATRGAAAVVAAPRPDDLEAGALTGAASSAASEMNLVCASADLPDTITLANATEYLPYLEDGSTQPRAPFVSGWIAQTVAAWPAIVSDAVRRVRASGRAT